MRNILAWNCSFMAHPGLPSPRRHDGQKALQLFLGIDDGKHDRAVMRETKRFVLVNSAVGPVTQDAPIHGNARQIMASHGADESFVERFVFPLVAFAYVD